MTDETSPSPKEAFPLTIPRPCPMLVSRMTPEGDNFHCQTCQHVTYDLREKSQEEVHEFFKRQRKKSGAFGLFGDRTPKVRVRSLVALFGIEDLA